MEKITNEEIRAEDSEVQALENAIRILARMIVGAIIREITVQRKALYEVGDDLATKATPTEHPGEGLTITPTEAAKLLRVGRTMMYEAVRTRRIPSIRLGRRILIPRIALAKFIEQATSNGESTG